jgi:hypothetical protein
MDERFTITTRRIMNPSMLGKKSLLVMIAVLNFIFSALGVGVVFGIVPVATENILGILDIENRKLIARACLLGTACWSAFSFLAVYDRCSQNVKKGKR